MSTCRKVLYERLDFRLASRDPGGNNGSPSPERDEMKRRRVDSPGTVTISITAEPRRCATRRRRIRRACGVKTSRNYPRPALEATTSAAPCDSAAAIFIQISFIREPRRGTRCSRNSSRRNYCCPRKPCSGIRPASASRAGFLFLIEMLIIPAPRPPPRNLSFRLISSGSAARLANVIRSNGRLLLERISRRAIRNPATRASTVAFPRESKFLRSTGIPPTADRRRDFCPRAFRRAQLHGAVACN